MASGDVKSQRGRGGGWGSSYYYDDEGRGQSKDLWEEFRKDFTTASTQDQMEGDDFPRTTAFLLEMPDIDCYKNLFYSTYRYNLEDIGNYHNANLDSRAKRLVEKTFSNEMWLKFHAHLVEGYDRRKAEKLREEQERRDAYKAQEEIRYEEREAKAAEVKRADDAQISKEVDLVSGAFRSDLHQAFSTHERHDRDEGDYIDDVVMASQFGRGFGEEEKVGTGVKVQFTLSLDLSNSMYYNKVHIAASDAFRQMGNSLNALKNETPGDMYVGFFTFSKDSWEGDGKRADCLSTNRYGDENWYEFEEYKPSRIESMKTNGWDARGMFSGEDTWVHPLFQEIEKWENKFSDPGAARLDIVLTDAVMEHPTDIRKSDAIQARRNGNTQTIFLNFMPEEDWSEGTMPLGVVQYPANADNIAGLLRQVVSNFLALYL